MTEALSLIMVDPLVFLKCFQFIQNKNKQNYENRDFSISTM